MTITIGSDPEFVIVNERDSQIGAWEFFLPMKKTICKKEKCDERYCHVDNVYCGREYESPQIGCDGSLGELRPKPGNTPLEHIDNIKNLIDILTLPDGWKILAGTRPKNLSTGGHIHIGFVPKDLHFLANYLSYYCGIPLRKIEHEKDIEHRGLSPNNFGYYGSYDRKSYGIEWRMPASWLITKEIATSAICLAHVVATEFSINQEDVPITNSVYVRLIDGDISSILSKIEKMKEYELYSKEIEPLIQMIVNGEKWDTTLNVKEQW